MLTHPVEKRHFPHGRQQKRSGNSVSPIETVEGLAEQLDAFQNRLLGGFRARKDYPFLGAAGCRGFTSYHSVLATPAIAAVDLQHAWVWLFDIMQYNSMGRWVGLSPDDCLH